MMLCKPALCCLILAANFLLVPSLSAQGQKDNQEKKNPARELKLDGDRPSKVQAQLAADDARDSVPPGRPHHRYEVSLSAGAYCKIDVQSRVFDTFLRLEDAAGKELASDDDGGEGTNSRWIFHAPKDGTYRIIVTTFDGKVGSYELAVQKIEAQEGKRLQAVLAAKLNAQIRSLTAKLRHADAAPLARRELPTG